MRDTLGIPLTPLDHDPLVAVYVGRPWEPWPVEASVPEVLERVNNSR